MIRAIVNRPFTNSLNYAEYFGKSTDEKPVAGIVTGSMFIEVDTGDYYLFDESGNGTWTKIGAGWVNPEA